MERSTVEFLAREGVHLRTYDLGRQYTRCPRCVAGARHIHNRRARKLGVDIRPDGTVLWFCNNCEWAGEISPHAGAHRQAEERKLDPELCARLGIHSADQRTVGFHYFVNGAIHNTKLRRGKGNMPWAHGGRELVLWNLDCLAEDPAPDEEVIVTEGEFDAIAFIQAGFTRVVSVPNGAQSGGDQSFKYLFADGGQLIPALDKFGRFVLATDADSKGLACRDALARRLGDERCRWVAYPPGCKDANDTLLAAGLEAVRAAVVDARPMWTDEVATIDDVPDPPPDEARYQLGIPELDHHGLRLTLPALWTLVGPYGSGKSVLLRQLLCGFWRQHRWRALLTSFEERIKPRYHRDLRRHFIARPLLPDAPWTAEEMAAADEEIRGGFLFLRRAKGQRIDPDRVLDRVEFAARVYGIKVVAIDPINELTLRPPPGQSKTDYLGDFIMDLKDLGEDYGLLTIVVVHPPKDSTERRLARNGILTLNDGADTGHWGNKSDIGWCIWRDMDGPTILNVDKLKDHETMGRPTIAELELDKALSRFCVRRLGPGVLRKERAGDQ